MSLLHAIFPRRRVIELIVVGVLTFLVLQCVAKSDLLVGMLGSLYASFITGVVDHLAQRSVQKVHSTTLDESEKAVTEIVKAVENAQRYTDTAFRTGSGLNSRDTVSLSRAIIDARVSLERVRVNLSHLAGRGGAR